MIESPISKLAQLFQANLKKAAQFQQISGREAARRGKLDAKTFSNAGRAANAITLRSVEGLSRGVGFEPWQLLVPGFDPQRPPDLRKRGSAATRAQDQLTEMMLALWSNLSPNERVSVLNRAQEVATEVRGGAPPGPPHASQVIR